MKIEQRVWVHEKGWKTLGTTLQGKDVQLVFVFGSRESLSAPERLDVIRQAYPAALLFGCSTAGEICGERVYDGSIVATALHFEHTAVREAHTTLQAHEQSFDAGRALAEALDRPDLVHVVVLSDGIHVNGSELVKGLVDRLPEGVKVTGGLSGDGDRFQRTLVLKEGVPREKALAAVGFYGNRLKIGYGSIGGWDPFGPERLITRSKGNILYEVDGQPALELYKAYLGKHAEGLPASGLLFPLMLRFEGREQGLVRTILAVDEEKGSLIFAGDVPEGAYARLMKANFDRLVDGAIESARVSTELSGGAAPDFALLISCVGRKMILKQRIEEEVEGVRDILGDKAILTGFYSYGEISPTMGLGSCELHNQTMTVTTFKEL